MTVISRGNNEIRSLVGAYLEANLPNYIYTFQQQHADLNAEPNLLPMPAQYLAADPYDTKAHKYPIVGSYFTADEGYQNMQINSDGSLEFHVRYSATLFVTVVTAVLGTDAANLPIYAKPTRDSTIKQRDDLIGAMRACVLNGPSFGTADTTGPTTLRAELDTIRIGYPEPMALNQTNQTWICSGLMNVDITSVEKTAQAIEIPEEEPGQIGEVSQINIDIYNVNEPEEGDPTDSQGNEWVEPPTRVVIPD